jgi:hypothetical protein
MKICRTCEVEKELDCFTRDSLKKDGVSTRCKDCDKLDRLRRKESIKEKNIKYYQINKDRINTYHKQWMIENKEWVCEYNKMRNNDRSYKDRRNNYIRNRKQNDPIFRLRISISRLVYNSLKNNGFKKKSRSNKILGCSYIEFKSYIETKFEPWMTWENKGLYNGNYNYGWDIDHIIPISSARTEEEVVKLNHYTNFRPLCSKINRDIKRDKIENPTT